MFSAPTVARYQATLAPMKAQPTPTAAATDAAAAPQRNRPRPAPVESSTSPNKQNPASDISTATVLSTEDATEVAVAAASVPSPPPLQSPPQETSAAAPRIEEPVAPAAAVTSSDARKSTLPPFAEQISIDYKLSSPITDGVANFKWSRKGEQYEIESSIQATGFLVSAFAGIIHQKSAGDVTEEGLRPREFFIRRGEGEAETAEFLHANNALTFKRRNEGRVVPLARGLQDMQSFLFQLAYLAPRMANTDERIDMMVTNARKVYRYQFQRVGVETLQTRFGAVDTIRLISEAANPEDAYEVWLAPSYQYLPVKLRYYLGRFRVEQLATRIGSSAPAASATQGASAAQ
jgi:hypothetical protein